MWIKWNDGGGCDLAPPPERRRRRRPPPPPPRNLPFVALPSVMIARGAWVVNRDRDNPGCRCSFLLSGWLSHARRICRRPLFPVNSTRGKCTNANRIRNRNRIEYDHYLPTVILIVMNTYYWYSITHSLFHSRLKSFLFCKSSLPHPFLFLI